MSMTSPKNNKECNCEHHYGWIYDMEFCDMHKSMYTEITSPKKAQWEGRLDAILDGLDKDECEYKHGWWETSTGAEFGAKKKEEIKSFISKTHTELLTTLKEGVKLMRRESILDNNNLSIVEDTSKVLDGYVNYGYNEAVDDIQHILDSLLVTDDTQDTNKQNDTK